MQSNTRQTALLLLLLAISAGLWGLTHNRSLILFSDQDALSRILDSGVIRVVTKNSPYTRYLYRGEQEGFEYDLASAFADYLGVRLEVLTPEPGEMLMEVESGRGDILAANFHHTKERLDRVNFSIPYASASHYIVAHRKNRSIQALKDLEGKTIHVRAGSAAEEALEKLRGLGLHFKINSRLKKTDDQLLGMVRDRQLELAAADIRVARVNQRHHPEINPVFPVDEPVSIGWAVKKNNPHLLRKINAFFAKAISEGLIDDLHERYFGNGEPPEYLDVRRFHNRLESRLPRYRKIIEDVASDNDMDWRLIAAMMYQESRFNPFAVSRTGVRGLMQVTRATAEEMGIEDRLDPVQSVKAGGEYMRRLMEWFEDAEEPDRLRLALAAYNVGYGHVRDAMKLAEKKGMNPRLWASVEKTLPLLRKRKYYINTRHGYCRGFEPVHYVNGVLVYYDILKRKAIIL